MPSSYFCGCISGFRKSAHVLNEPIGSCYLKYAGTRGRFYYYICWLAKYSLSDVAKLAAHPKFVWVSNASCDETIIYNDPVEYLNVYLIHFSTI
jgi:hypothetical protein